MRNKLKWIIVFFIIILIYWIYVITAPWRTMKQFVYAIEQKDATAIVALALPEEISYCGLTEQSVKNLLDATLCKWSPFKAIYVEKVPLIFRPMDIKLNRHKWLVIWGNAKTGNPIKWNKYIKNGFLFSEISIYPTNEGWRVNVTEFLICLTLFVYGKSDYLSILKSYGIKGYVSPLTEPGTFEPLTLKEGKER